MKRLRYAFGIVAILSIPVHAADLCREEAKAVGYVAALELLEPCQPKAVVTALPTSDDQIQKEAKSKSDTQSIAHVDRNLKR